MSPSGRSNRRIVFWPLLFALILSGAAAAAPPFSYEQAWKDARAADDRGESVTAAKIVDDALRRAGNSDAEPVWALRVMRAQLFFQNGKTTEAEKIMAIPLPPRVRNTAAGARHVLTQAMLKRGDPALIRKAHDIAATFAPQVLPEILPLLGDEASVRKAISLARNAGDRILEAKAKTNLVRVYGRQGRYAEAIRLGEDIRADLAKLGLVKVGNRNFGNLGWLYAVLGDYDQAAEILPAAAAACGSVGDRDAQLNFLAQLANVRSVQRDWKGIVEACRSIIDATASEPHETRGWAYSSLARAYLELGQTANARDAVRQALALEKDQDGVLITRVVEARIDTAGGNYDVARKTLSEVIAKASKPATKLTALGQLARLQTLTKQPALAEKTFAQASNLVREARASVTDFRLRLSVFNTASELYDNYIDFLVDARRDQDALLIAETSRAQTLAEGLDLPSATKLDPRAIAKQRNATILCYWLGRNRSYVWTITAAGIKRTTIPLSDTAIEKPVEKYRGRLVTSAGTLDRARLYGEQLYEMLIPGEVRRLPRESRVIVIPDGRLHTLNFETLIVPAERPHYWIEDVVVANASSLQLLARTPAKSSAAPRMLLVGNPEQPDQTFPMLPKAGVEIQRIRHVFGPRATVLAGKQATPAAYAAAKPQAFDFVHFAAHGIATPTRPLESAVILGCDQSGNYRLAGSDIAARRLSARLVTISSCHGAGSATYAGEGLVGLAWAFLHAGAQQVVAALWAVNDSAAPDLMEDMYKGLAAGKDPAVALRAAKLELLRSKSSYKHAKFWAPFIIYV